MCVYRVVADSAYFMTCEEITSCANKKSAKMADSHRFTLFPKVTRDATSMNKNSQLPNNLSLPYELRHALTSVCLHFALKHAGGRALYICMHSHSQLLDMQSEAAF